MVGPVAPLATSPKSPTASYVGSMTGSGRPSLRRSPSSRFEEDSRAPPHSQNVVLLVQEWLTIMNFPVTLQSFLDEYTRVLHQSPPALDKWYEMTQAIDLTSLTANSVSNPLESRNPALLERIVAQAFARFRRRHEPTATRTPTTVVVSKRPATAAPGLKFVNKRSLPVGSACSTHSKSMTALPSPTIRPKSALASATSRSTADLTSENGKTAPRVHSDSPRGNNDDEQSLSPTKKRSTTGSPPRDPQLRSSQGKSPTSPNDSKPVNGANSPTAMRRVSSIKPSGTSKRLTTQSSSSARVLSRDGTVGRKQTFQSNADPTERADIEARPELDEFESTVNLEDMTEEHLAEQFTAFSRSNLKKLRRVLVKSSVHSQELQRTRTALDKIQQRAQHRHEQSAFAAKQTDLLSTTMDMLVKEPCSLCRFVFLKKSLTTRVSYKSICDLRASWAAKKKQERKDAKAITAAAGVYMLRQDPAVSEDETDGTDGPTMALDSTQQISHLYDEVPVCAFCAQLALDFSSYRPSSAEQREHKEAERRLNVEKQKQREVQRQRDDTKCDPLDFHSYELNSDDEDEEVEIDEVLEVDANGRVQVVRRPRNRRRTVRTPAQTGLVSRRIHYENLRSQSVHALNRKEWEVISQCQLGN